MYANPDGVSSKIQKATFECGKCGAVTKVNRELAFALASGKQVAHSCVGETLFFPCVQVHTPNRRTKHG